MNRIDLNRCDNKACYGNCNKDDRRQCAENDLCRVVKSNLDSLSVRCVGDWAEEKIYLLYQYFGIFTKGMKNKWKEINYIEICSGPGRCINRGTRQEIDGTAMSILKHEAFPNIHKALFFDYNKEVVDVLNTRIEGLGLSNAYAYEANYKDPAHLCNILRSHCSKDKSLNLILIDPTDCGVPFELIRCIKDTLNNVDMIINVAIGTDFNRNVPMAFADSNRAQKYISFLGSDAFFCSDENKFLCRRKQYDKLREHFRKAYQDSMRTLGYSVFRVRPVKNYYDILFAACHERAADFWDKAQKINFDGQLDLF